MGNDRKSCMVCHGARLHKFIDLGRQPNGNNFLMADDLASEPFFDLSMMVRGMLACSNFPVSVAGVHVLQSPVRDRN